MYGKSKRKALAATDAAIAAAREKLTAGLSSYPVDEQDAALMECVVGDTAVCGFLPMSNFAVRRFAQCALIDEVMHHWRYVRGQKGVRHFLFTASFDDGIVFEDEPNIPLAKIKRKVARALRSISVDAICAVEIDVLSKKLPGEHSRRLLVHVHAICWTADPAFGPITAAAALTKGWAFRNMLGAPAITFVSRAQSSKRWPGFMRAHPQRDQIASSMAWLAYYLLKAPHFAKNRVVMGTKAYMRADAGAFRQKTALRFAELWSSFEPSDVVFGVGAGTDVAARFANAMRAYERRNRASGASLEPRTVRQMWKKHFAAHPALGFARTRFQLTGSTGG